MQHETIQDQWKRIAGEAAVEFIEAGMVIGIGTGSTASYMIQALARRLQAGLNIVGARAASSSSPMSPSWSLNWAAAPSYPSRPSPLQ